MSFRLYKLPAIAALCIASSMLFVSCKSTPSNPPAPAATYTVTYLTSDVTVAGASTDANLLNAWGLSFDPMNSLLVAAANHGSSASAYDSTTGAKLGLTFNIPRWDSAAGGGAPSGMVLAPSGFTIKNAGSATYIFATEDGTLSAWDAFIGSNPAIITVNNNSAGAVYKGITAIGSTLYVSNFHVNQIESYDHNFSPGATYNASGVVPTGYGPFNVQNIDGKLYATYARKKVPDSEGGVDDSAGVGIGAIVTFNGNTPTLFAQAGTLNSPWGLAKAPSNFGQYSNDILVGNFGDGTINVFDNTGKYLGQLQDANGKVIVVDGLWALLPSPAANSSRVYFTAGPNGENDGRIGFIDLKR